MNKNLIKGIFIFAAGVGVGAFSAIRFVKNKYEKIVQEELTSIREVSAGRENRRNNKENGEYIRPVRRNEGDSDVENAYSDPSDMDKCMDEDEEYQKYKKISGNYIKEVKKPGPYVIDTEQFSNEMDHFDKLTLYYYVEDDTLTDDNEEIIAEELEIIGNALDGIDGSFGSEPYVVYVRNEKMEADYEVICLYKSYSETVLGMRGDDEHE